jgi:tripartite-type tricarboxylate transporter receptor subunit TctC
MSASRRTFLKTLPAGMAALSPLGAAFGQTGGSAAPLRIVVPFGAGGGGDTLARFIAERLPASMGPVVVDNRPGASSLIGSAEVVRAAPDGRTVLLNVPILVQAPAMQAKPTFDPVRDLAAVSEIVTAPLWLVVNAEAVKAKTLAEFAPAMRAPSAPRAYGSIGPGSTGHLLGHTLNEALKLDLTHVPYKGSSQAVLALLAGDVGVAYLDLVTVRPHLESGKLRVLASTGERRSANTPDVPTFKEAGYPGFEFLSWAGFFVPAKTPANVIAQLNEEFRRVIETPQAQAKFRELGYEPGQRNTAQFAELVRTDQQRWTELIRRAGIKME